MKKLRILLADDHIVMRTGLRALLERQPNLEVVDETENGRETVELAALLGPDVVVRRIRKWRQRSTLAPIPSKLIAVTSWRS
jgi:DNA-binding NarL/FixJ family response regulator